MSRLKPRPTKIPEFSHRLFSPDEMYRLRRVLTPEASPGGTFECSPPFQRWACKTGENEAPEGRLNLQAAFESKVRIPGAPGSATPTICPWLAPDVSPLQGLAARWAQVPPLKRWATVFRPSGTGLLVVRNFSIPVLDRMDNNLLKLHM